VGWFDCGEVPGWKKERAEAHILEMNKRIGWTTCNASDGRYAVAALLEGGVVGNGFGKPTFATKEEAQAFIDSGQADQAARFFDEIKRKGK
jgi:hypothetical protein